MISLKFVIGLFIVILVFHTLAVINNWYWTCNWIDMPMHFLGGLWLALLFFYFINPKLSPYGRPPEGRQINNYEWLITLISVLGFVILVGVLWEFFEFLFDVFIASKGYLAVAQQGTADTMADLFFDLLGGLVAWIIYSVRCFAIAKQ